MSDNVRAGNAHTAKACERGFVVGSCGAATPKCGRGVRRVPACPCVRWSCRLLFVMLLLSVAAEAAAQGTESSASSADDRRPSTPALQRRAAVRRARRLVAGRGPVSPRARAASRRTSRLTTWPPRWCISGVWSRARNCCASCCAIRRPDPTTHDAAQQLLTGDRAAHRQHDDSRHRRRQPIRA